MAERVKTFFKRYKLWIVTLAAVALSYAVMFAVGIGCPIKFFSGISCAGCGMTRACLSALRFDFAEAFYYHPLWVVLPIGAILLAVFGLRGKKKAFAVTGYTFVALLILVYVIRMLFSDGVVVNFSFSEGFVYRLWQNLSN